MQADFQAIMQELEQARSDCPTSSYECPLCRDSGWVDAGARTVAPCRCQAVKREKKRILESGLSRRMEVMTFDRFLAREPWQVKALGVVRRWMEAQGCSAGGSTEGATRGEDSPQGLPQPRSQNRGLDHGSGRAWLFLGGAVGSGKTHLCTAACRELLRAGRAVRYMLWPEEVRALKGCVNDAEAFERLIRPLERVDVLYIDDLFKVQRSLDGSAAVTPAEVRVAFELIDARYRMDRPTIISCEWLMDELLQMDEGVFSRVYEKSRGFIAQIGRENGRNFRLWG